MSALVAVHAWRDPSSHWIGQGTRLEFDHWRAEGVIGDDVQLAELLGHEPASEDERRKAAWAREMA